MDAAVDQLFAGVELEAICRFGNHDNKDIPSLYFGF